MQSDPPTRRRISFSSQEAHQRDVEENNSILNVGFSEHEMIYREISSQEAEYFGRDTAFVELALSGRTHGHDFVPVHVVRLCHGCFKTNRFKGFRCLKCYRCFDKDCGANPLPCPNRIPSLKVVPPARSRLPEKNLTMLPKSRLDQLRKALCIEICLQRIYKKGAEVKGIYRMSGNSAMIKLLFAETMRGGDLEDLLEGVECVHNVAGLFKKLLAESQELFFSHFAIGRLLTIIGYYRMLLARVPPEEVGNPDMSVVVVPDSLPRPVLEDIAYALRELPDINMYVLRMFFEHLSRIASKSWKNGMTSWNLSLIFSAVLFQNYVASDSNRFFHSYKIWCTAISLFIEHYEVAFAKKIKRSSLFPADIESTFPTVEEEYAIFVEKFRGPHGNAPTEPTADRGGQAPG